MWKRYTTALRNLNDAIDEQHELSRYLEMDNFEKGMERHKG